MRQTRSDGTDLLTTEELSKYFIGVRALDSVNITLEKGEITLLLGPNGSGKTTLISTITGFHKADRGRVILEGRDITNLPPHQIYNLGITRTFQIPRPLKRMTVLENLMIGVKSSGDGIWGSFRRKWLKEEDETIERAFNLLEFLGLKRLAHHPASDLSGGESKLLELGRALMPDTKLLIMDEPLAGIAPQLAEKLLNRLREIKELGIGLLLIEHRLDLVLPYADKIYVMAEGKIIAKGDEEVLDEPSVLEAYLGA